MDNDTPFEFNERLKIHDLGTEKPLSRAGDVV
jgi:hypothetical protein